MSTPTALTLEPITLNPAGIFNFMAHSLKAGLVPFVKGSPGIGKSDIARKVAKDFNLKLIDFRLSQCDPTDLNGFPSVNDKGRATYMPMTTWPLVGDDLPKADDGTPMDGWLVFFDELPAASPAVQAAAYKILLDRMVGEFKLHPRVMMAAAGNLVTDNAVAEDLSTALQSRLIHAQLQVNLKDWQQWAADTKIDHRITSFLEWKPQLLYSFDPNHTDNTFPCPRTWEFTDKQLKAGLNVGQDPAFDRALLSGTIGQGAAREFIAFCNFFSKLPTIADIVKDPKGVKVPEEPGVLYAMSGSIAAHIDGSNAAPLFEFLQRMPIEYQVIGLRTAIRRDQSIAKTPGIIQWVMKNSASLF